VVARSGADPSGAEILDYCRGNIASFKIPRHILFLDELPMTSTGKVRKVELRDLALSSL